MSRIIGENISVRTNLNPDIWSVWADEGNLQQVIMNIMVNARDAMPEGGTISLKTENVKIDDNYCNQYPYAHTGEFVCLSIADKGFGIGEENLPYIFDPFFTLKEVGKGSGLGLSVAYGIIKQHRGWINVFSEPNKGSTFKIYLKSISPEEKKTPKTPPVLAEIQGKGERILVVEDEKGVLELTSRILRKNGYVVFHASSIKEAETIFKKEKSNFNLVFCDVVLTNENGIKLVEKITNQNPGIKVLLGSGYADWKTQWPEIDKRGYNFISKPYTISTILQSVKSAIENSHFKNNKISN